jgi:8-oxo-dGTP pyrophosphatase MutT (NUDIX family)
MDLTSIIDTLQNYQPVMQPETPHAAAVLILLMYDEDNNYHLIVTKRSESVATYVGDYCFPGGMKEMSDPDLQYTALRETGEELALQPENYQLVGQLDDFYDHYDNLVRPYIATISQHNFATLHTAAISEVAEIYYFPLENLKLINHDTKLEKLSLRYPTYSYKIDKVLIWGLTASMMVHLGNILFGLAKPIAKRRDKKANET